MSWFKELEKDLHRLSEPPAERSKPRPTSKKKKKSKPVKQPLKPFPLDRIADPYVRELVARQRKEMGISES